MTRAVPKASVTQECPNCGKVHDIGIYISGQKLLCDCGIRFSVMRSDVSTVGGSPSAASALAPTSKLGSDVDLGPTLAPSKERHEEPEPSLPPATAVSQAPTLPGFELREVLGKGGMGEVWKARQVSLDREVAVKVLPAKLARDKEFVARFEKEAAALAALSHPNIIQIIDRGHFGESYYFVMEFVAGRTLRDVLHKSPPSFSQALKWVVQMARALDHAHQKHIIHRDLKPENVLIDEAGHLKVADFGLAGMRGAAVSYDLTATAVAMGTVNYMAPEQRRDAKNVDHRADLYSLGVVTYELLTHELPFGRFKLPSERNQGLDARVDAIVGAMLETDPEARPASAAQVANELEALISSSPHVSRGGALFAEGAAQGRRRDTNPERPKALEAAQSVLRAGSGLPVGIGAVALLAVVMLGAKFWPSTAPAAPLRAPAWYADSDDVVSSGGSTAPGDVDADFSGVGPVELNTHAGRWQVADGVLEAVQFGGATDVNEHPLLVPRAYVSQRYFSADDYTAEVDVSFSPLPAEFPSVAPEAQRFAELSFRIRDLQVSAFAIPHTGLRLLWRYFGADGLEIVGNSAKDTESLVEDEVQVPSMPFRLRLQLRKGRGGSVDAEAFVNGQRFARKTLPALAGQVGKVALGCRNLVCRFDNLKAKGQPAPRPKVVASGEAGSP